jgi:hypothetical protein
MNRAGKIERAITLGAIAAVTSGCSNGQASLGNAPEVMEPEPETTLVWDGYIENFQFTSGSDAIHVELDVSASPTVTGTVLFGGAPLLPPVSDPDVGYPSGLDRDGPPGGLPYEGFQFTATDGDLTQDRLRFNVSRLEVWAGWCALQTPILSEGADPPFYGCLINSYTWDDTGCISGNAPIDCGKLYLCNLSRTCECVDTGCTVESGEDLAFDLLLDQDQAHGSVTGLRVNTTYNVWMTQAP